MAYSQPLPHPLAPPYSPDSTTYSPILPASAGGWPGEGVNWEGWSSQFPSLSSEGIYSAPYGEQITRNMAPNALGENVLSGVKRVKNVYSNAGVLLNSSLPVKTGRQVYVQLNEQWTLEDDGSCVGACSPDIGFPIWGRISIGLPDQGLVTWDQMYQFFWRLISRCYYPANPPTTGIDFAYWRMFDMLSGALNPLGHPDLPAGLVAVANASAKDQK